MAWYRVEMVGEEQTATVVSVPEKDCKAIEAFMDQCSKYADSIPAWVGGQWHLCGPYKTQDEAWVGWSK